MQIEVKDLPPPDVAHLKELADEIYELGRKKLELVAKGERETLQSTVLYAYEKYADQVTPRLHSPLDGGGRVAGGPVMHFACWPCESSISIFTAACSQHALARCNTDAGEELYS